jgi:hypothetical protein
MRVPYGASSKLCEDCRVYNGQFEGGKLGVRLSIDSTM